MPRFPVRELTPFGKEVKKKLIELDMTQTELAEKLNVGTPYLTDILYGSRTGYTQKEKIAEILGIEYQP